MTGDCRLDGGPGSIEGHRREIVLEGQLEQLAGQESETMQGIFLPAGTPKEIVDLLNREIAKVMVMPDVKEKCAQLGFDVVANKPDEFAAYIKKEVEKWGKVIKDANIPQIQ